MVRTRATRRGDLPRLLLALPDHLLSHFFDETLDLYSAARLEMEHPFALCLRAVKGGRPPTTPPPHHDTEYTKSGSITLTERVWVDQGGDWDDSLPSWTAEFGPWRREDSDSDSDS